MEKDNLLHWANEAKICSFVQLGLKDILSLLKMRSTLNIESEINILFERPDIIVIQTDGRLPICVVEVKKPGKNGQTD